ncbi:MAG: MucR family transcriptional regulator, partial [Zymomonas sp.]
MTDELNDATADARDGTIELVSAYVSNSNTRISAEELQSLIRDTFATLSTLKVDTRESETPEASSAEPKSKAEIRKSIGADALISFEDSRPYKSLKRHLGTRGLTPEDYRTKWGLPADYPMVHPTYSAKRSELARSIGLGSKGRGGQPAAAAPTKKA